MWLMLAKYAFQIAIMAVSKVPPAQWAKIGVLITNFLQNIEDKLPAGSPVITHLNAYKAPRALLMAPKPEAEKWDN